MSTNVPGVQRGGVPEPGSFSIRLKRGPLTPAWIAREIAAICIWIFIFIKLFLFDVDVFIVKTISPAAVFLLSYRFFFLFGMVALAWILLGNKRFGKLIAYLSTYPLIVLLWKIPKLIFKNWAGVLILLPTAIPVIRSFKQRFLVAFFAVTAAFLIILNSPPLIDGVCMVILIVVLVVHFYRRFQLAFAHSEYFGKATRYLKSFKDRDEFKKSIAIPDEMQRDSPEYAEKRLGILELLLTLNRAFLFIARKLKKAQEGQIALRYCIVALLQTVLITILVFAFEYYGLRQINSTSWSGNAKPGIGMLLYYSFNVFAQTTIDEVKPASGLARLLTAGERVSSLVVGIILLFLFLTIVREKYKEEIDEVITELNVQGKLLEESILSEYQLALAEAIERITSNKPQFRDIIGFLDN